MGMIAKLMNGKKKTFKVTQKCNTCGGGVSLIVSKSGRDLVKAWKDNDTSVLNEMFDRHCDKCVLTVDELALEDIKRAKKIFSVREID